MKILFILICLLSTNVFAAQFNTFQYTKDWVHAIEAKDDIRQFNNNIQNQDKWFSALKRQPVKWGKKTKVTYAQLQQVNETLNKAFKLDDDLNIWGKLDYTATPNELKRKGAGDCEDFSLLKYHALAMLGLNAAQMNVYSGYYVYKTKAPIAHNILVVEISDGSEWVLDIMINEVMPASEYMFKYFIPISRLDNKYVAIY